MRREIWRCSSLTFYIGLKDANSEFASFKRIDEVVRVHLHISRRIARRGIWCSKKVTSEIFEKKILPWNITWVFKKKYKTKKKKFQLKFTFPKSTSYCEFKTVSRSSIVYLVQKWSPCTLDQANTESSCILRRSWKSALNPESAQVPSFVKLLFYFYILYTGIYLFLVYIFICMYSMYYASSTSWVI